MGAPQVEDASAGHAAAVLVAVEEDVDVAHKSHESNYQRANHADQEDALKNQRQIMEKHGEYPYLYSTYGRTR